MMGTEYLLRGRGGDGTMHKGFNKQLLAVNYNPTINHIHAAPRTMTAVLPVPDSRVGDLAIAASLRWLSPNDRLVISQHHLHHRVCENTHALSAYLLTHVSIQHDTPQHRCLAA